MSDFDPSIFGLVLAGGFIVALAIGLVQLAKAIERGLLEVGKGLLKIGEAGGYGVTQWSSNERQKRRQPPPEGDSP